jgi:hypothetical protein
MAWSRYQPQAGIKAKNLAALLRTNNDALEATLFFGHDFASGGTQTGEHNIGSCKIYRGTTAPIYKEDGATLLDATDVSTRLWLDTTATPATLKVLTTLATINIWTSIGELAGGTTSTNVLKLTETTDPTAVENVGFIYAKVSATKTEFFIMLDSGGTAIQLTKNALLYLNNARLDNLTYLKAVDLAGTGTVDLIKAGQNEANDTDVAIVPDKIRTATNAAPLEATGVANKKYVDDHSTMSPATTGVGTGYAGEQSVTFPNGLIMKFGYVATTNGVQNTSVTFGAAFPTALISLVCTPKRVAGFYARNRDLITAASVTAFTVTAESTDTGCDGYYWQAIGR